jgi:hypothetical protein
MVDDVFGGREGVGDDFSMTACSKIGFEGHC